MSTIDHTTGLRAILANTNNLQKKKEFWHCTWGIVDRPKTIQTLCTNLDAYAYAPSSVSLLQKPRRASCLSCKGIPVNNNRKKCYGVDERRRLFFSTYQQSTLRQLKQLHLSDVSCSNSSDDDSTGSGHINTRLKNTSLSDTDPLGKMSGLGRWLLLLLIRNSLNPESISVLITSVEKCLVN